MLGQSARRLVTSDAARCTQRLGVGFRRQVVIGRYIADFVAPSIKLVVEVDGGYHASAAVRRKDARRDRALGRLGYRVVHVSADAVQHRLGEAVEAILVAIEACS